MIHTRAFVIFGILCFTGQLWAMDKQKTNFIKIYYYDSGPIGIKSYSFQMSYQSSDTFADLKKKVSSNVCSQFNIKAEDIAEISTSYCASAVQSSVTDFIPIAQLINQANTTGGLAIMVKTHKYKDKHPNG